LTSRQRKALAVGETMRLRQCFVSRVVRDERRDWKEGRARWKEKSWRASQSRMREEIRLKLWGGKLSWRRERAEREEMSNVLLL
jgi:hypothetical protein